MRCTSYDRNLAEILVDSDEGATFHASARKYLFPAQVSAGLSVGRANAPGVAGVFAPVPDPDDIVSGTFERRPHTATDT